MSLRARLPTDLCHAATGSGRSRFPGSRTESLSSVTSSPDGSSRICGSAATVPASTTTLTATIAPPFPMRNLPRPTDILEDAAVRSREARLTSRGRYTPPLVETTSEGATGLTAIDTRMAGRTMVTSAYLVAAREPALVETGPTTSADAVLEELARLGMGPADLAHIVLTHIHLDHAGGAGRLAARFPTATVWVHERGAPHLADPGRLVASAARVYGEERLRTLFGPVDPVPSDRLRAIGEGDLIPLGDRRLEVLYTPGHASHHVSLVDSLTGALFTGDALGIHLPDVRVLRPATPPPDIDIEAGVHSIERIRGRAESFLMFSHFGPV